MKLSADSLNLRSPYHLLQLGDLTFRFITDQQIHYTVGFYKDTIFMDDGAYHFFIDNSENEHGSYDPKILEVVTVILEAERRRSHQSVYGVIYTKYELFVLTQARVFFS